jgi:hypothetical protein
MLDWSGSAIDFCAIFLIDYFLSFSIFPLALAKEAMVVHQSWMTTSDDYHTKKYPLPDFDYVLTM